MEKIEEIKEDLKNILSEERYIHSMGVMETAKRLAEIYNISEEKASLAGLTHDIAKEMKPEEYLSYVKEHSIEIDEVERNNPKLLHGKVGADIVKNKYNLDKQIQDAIKYHTTTNKDMDMLAKIVYVADKIEPNRKSEAYDIETERKMAKESINKTIIYIINEYIKSLIEKEKLIHPNAIETRNKLILEEKRQEENKN